MHACGPFDDNTYVQYDMLVCTTHTDLRCTLTVESISSLFDFSVRSWSTGPKNGERSSLFKDFGSVERRI